MNRFVSLSLMLLLTSQMPGFMAFGQSKTTNPCLPAYTQNQRDSIGIPPDGFMLFNQSSGCINIFGKGKWREFCQNSTSTKTAAGTVKYEEATDRFLYNDGEKWIPFESYAEEVRAKRSAGTEQQEYTEETGANQLNGEITFADEKNKEAIKASPSITDCSKPPTTANAGKDMVSIDDVQLTANLPLHGKGRWIVLKGDGAVFSDSTVHNTIFKGVRGTTYYLRWEIRTDCDTSYDDALVRIRFPCDPEPSPSFAGVDKYNVERCFLNANPPESGAGSWQITQGVGGKVLEPENPNSEFTGVAGSTYVLKWVIRTECGFTEDAVKVTFKPPCRPKPSAADAGPDQLNVDTCVLSAQKPEFGKGKWSILKGTGGRILRSDIPNSPFTGKAENSYLLEWKVSTECGFTADTVKITFAKRCPKTIVDVRDGKNYQVVRLNEQCWLAENLNYRGVENFCYDLEVPNCEKYGALYTWKSAMNNTIKEGAQGACPDGWHVPTDAEWDELTSAPGHSNEDLRPNGGTGFNLLHGGTRYPNGKFFNRNQYAFYWSSTADGEHKAWNRYFNAESSESAHFSTDIENGFSVRCVQD